MPNSDRWYSIHDCQSQGADSAGIFNKKPKEEEEESDNDHYIQLKAGSVKALPCVHGFSATPGTRSFTELEAVIEMLRNTSREDQGR